MKSTLARIFVLIVLSCLISSHTWAGEVLNRISKTETLRVGMSGGQPPFNFKSKNGEMMGMEVDLAKLLAKSMDVELEIVETPFSELLEALEDGQVDLVMSGVTATLQRNLRVAFVGPYYVSGKSILTKSSTLAAIQQANELNSNSLSIVALDGSTSALFAGKAAPNAKLVTVSDYDEAINRLIAGKVDIFLADGPIIKLTALRYPNAGLAQLKKPLTLEPISIALPPDDPLLMNLIRNYLSAADASGALDGLRKKWFQSGSWLNELPPGRGGFQL